MSVKCSTRIRVCIVMALAYTTALATGVVAVRAASAQPAPPAVPQPAAEQAAPQATATQPSARQLEEWRSAISQVPKPGKGCFQSSYPSREWQQVPCVETPSYPQPPRRGPLAETVGNSNDISAQVPTGFIATAIGSFDSVTGVTSESGPIGNAGPAVANAYTLQLNTDFFASTDCAGSPNPDCRGWQQFVFENYGSGARAYIQYWLIRYNKTCPPGVGWNQFSFTGSSDIYCWKNNSGGAVSIPAQPITNLGSLTLTGAVSSSGDSISVSTGGAVYSVAGDNAVNAAAGWTVAEFNVFGDGGNSDGGGQANFNSGAALTPRTRVIYGSTAAPACTAQGFTAETNNLSFGPTAPAATGAGPAVFFEESSAGGALSNCAAATTIGEPHLTTFQGLYYDFQASGDFVLVQTDTDFVVQTRQVSGAPTWPNLSVNQGVAARMGKTTVAVCLVPPTGEAARQPLQPLVAVDGKAVAIADGQVLSPTEAVQIGRRGNSYTVRSLSGDWIRADVATPVNATAWINIAVGLGRWPAKVQGLLASAAGNVNAVVARDGTTLTSPFPFTEFYGRYGDSWRPRAGESLLAVCGDRAIERGIPSRAFYAADLDPKLRTQAQAVCTAAGVKPGPLFEACTLDVAVIGHDTAAAAFVGKPAPVAVGRSQDSGSTGGTGGIPNWIWVLLVLALIAWWLKK